MATAHAHAHALFDIEDPFQLNILDFSENELEDFEISSLFDPPIPITQMEMKSFLLLDLVYDPLYSSHHLSNIALPPLQDFNDDDVYCNALGGWNGNNIEKKQALPMCCNINSTTSGEGGSSKMVLTREMVSKYFYMPITKAARELNLGLTILKKRCRELGIARWPHRKLKSLNGLINNIEEGEESEETKRELIQELEREKRMIEEMPDAEMHKHTKRLRQSCFKDNYKKRKRMSMSMPIVAENIIEPTYYYGTQEYEELRSLLSSPDFIL